MEELLASEISVVSGGDGHTLSDGINVGTD